VCLYLFVAWGWPWSRVETGCCL